MRQLTLIPLLCIGAALPAWPQAITVYPGPATIERGATRQMSAYVPLSPNTVTWAVNGTVGGSAQFGTISANGFYTAPATVPVANTITIQVTSTADASKFGTAQIAITQPQTWVWGVSPSTFKAGAVSLSLNGSGFVAGAVVTINNQPLATTYVSPTKLTVADTVPGSMVGTAQIRAVNPAPGATTSTPVNVTVQAASPVSISLTPLSPAVGVGSTRQFTATVTGAANTIVTWTCTNGTINASGLYTAPAALPNPAVATVTATSAADPAVSATTTVTLTAPATSVTVTPSSAQVQTGATQQFSATVVNNANTSVTWSVNGVAGGNSTVGTVSAAGVYTAPASAPNPATVLVRATSVALPSAFGEANVTVTAPAAAPINLSHARFLDQAAFGPTAAELTNVAQLGYAGWLNQQFAMPESVIAVPADNGLAAQQYLSRLVHAPDQLRQRVINALSKIIVVSGAKNPYPNEVVPYWQLLSKHAFGSYRALLWDITVSPQMGKYLDLANSRKPSLGTAANENYPRELLQLFTTGLVMLKSDGSPMLDAANQPIPSYGQATVAQMALALTGWTYPTAPGGAPGMSNWEAFTGPMEPRDPYHDTSAKVLIGGCPSPAGQTVVQETNTALDCAFNHPNTAPFIVLRLIRELVTSNPSPAYVQRVVSVWNNNGTGAKGDLKAVVSAILLDAEARDDAASANKGRLKDAVYYVASFVRAMNGSLAPQNLRPWEFTQMGMAPLTPPSVFGHYALLFRVPVLGLAGPEFQIYTPTESVLRGNFIANMLSQPNQSDLKIDLAPYQAVAGNVSSLIDLVNSRLLYGRMTPAMKNSLTTMLNAQFDNSQRVWAALYLTALSGQHAVQH